MKRKLLLPFFLFAITNLIAQEKVTLDQVIKTTMEKNYDVVLSKNNADSKRTDNEYAFGAFLPQVSATGALGWSKTHQILEFTNTANNKDGQAEANTTNASIATTWTLFDGTKMFATRMRIEALAKQSDLQVKDQMINTLATTVVNYYNIVRQKQQLNAIREQMAVNEERVKLAEKKLSVGTGAKPELLQAKVDLNAQRALAVQQEATIAQLKEQLNLLTGRSLGQSFDVSDSIEINLNLTLSELTENIELNNYSLQAAKWNLFISDRALYESKASRSPVISFNGAYSYATTDNTKLLNPFSSIYFKNAGFNYGIGVSMPILTGLNTRRIIEQSRINLSRQQLLYDQQKLTVSTSLQNAFINYENAKKVLLIEEENILLAKENVSIALEAFRRGISTFIELRTAQQSLSDTYNQLITARYNAKAAEIELLRLSGKLLE
jgi:outer membrane protein TolC